MMLRGSEFKHMAITVRACVDVGGKMYTQCSFTQQADYDALISHMS